MQEIEIKITGLEISQDVAQRACLLLAKQENPETIVISRYNRIANACSPCCLGSTLGDRPGWEIYGETHGGRLKLSVNDGDYIFICS